MTDEVDITVTESPIAVAVAVTEAPVAVDIDASQGIEEAPVDGSTYGRKDADWVAVTVTETDPVFAVSPAAGIDAADIINWDGKQSALGFTPVNAASVEWIDLTDSGATTLHTHAADHAAVTLDVNADTVLSLSTQALGLDTQTANRVFAGPVSGAAAVPAFRALVSGDIPVNTNSSSITYDGDGYIATITVGGRTITYTRDVNHVLTSFTDTVNTWTMTYDGGGKLTAVTVT